MSMIFLKHATKLVISEEKLLRFAIYGEKWNENVFQISSNET